MIEGKNLNFKNKGIDIISDFNFKIPLNKTTCILGNKNSGKTSLLKILSKINCDYTGEILYKNNDLLKTNLKISFVSSDIEEKVNLNIYEYLSFYLKLYGFEGNINEEIDSYLNKTQMQIYKFTDWSLLSFEERKIITIIRAIICKPEIIFIDSLFAGLSDNNINKVKKLLTLTHKNATIIIAERDFNNLSDIVDYIIAIKDNKIIIEGELKEILKKLSTSNNIELQVLDDLEKTIKILNENSLINNISNDNSRVVFEFDGSESDANAILKSLIDNNVKVVSYKRDNSKYNDILNLINDATLNYTISKEEF